VVVTEPAHDHGSRARTAAARRALWIALAANGTFLFVEIAGGVVFGSLALLADAAHLFSDVGALTVALVAQHLVARPASARRTFGLRRAEALGAQANAALLLATSVWIFVEAANRLGDRSHVDGIGLLAVASAGFVVNVGAMGVLARVRGRDLNLRGAFLHMASDAAGSLGAVAAGIAVIAFDARWVDPFASILIGALVVLSAFSLLRDSTNVLLEGAPRGLDPQAVEDALGRETGVEAVHHLHLWELGSDLPALSAHVVLTGEPTLHDAQARGDELRAMLVARFGIEHATLELECHDCKEPDHDGTGRRASATARRR
jgi:cobalt-zinc-cadmium efflux system protein